MSETAFFVKNIVTPNGSVSITDGNKGASSDINDHTEVGHQELCDAQQSYMLRSIAQDTDLTRHMQDAIQSLKICIAADESIQFGRPVEHKSYNY